MVNATGQDGWRAGHGCRLSAQEIGAASTVAVDNIRSLVRQYATQSPDEAEIQVAGTRQCHDPDAQFARYGFDGGVPCANEDIVDSPGLKPLHEPDDLLRATVEMAPRLDVHDFHLKLAILAGIDLACTRG
jgi:hypothetical protein